MLRLIGAPGEGPVRRCLYRIAGVDVSAMQPIPELAAFASRPTGAAREVARDRFPPAEASATAHGWLAGSERAVRAAYLDDNCRVAVEALGEFAIRGERIACPGPASDVESALVREALLGPPLLLALARDRRYALHASAALVAGGELWVFVGPSGAGKSTLAASFASEDDCRTVADDILPVRWESGALWALPWYPQLKLGESGQYAGRGLPERLRVDAICALRPVGRDDAARAVRLDGVDAIKLLVGQTMASRLFAPEMLATHLRDAASAAGSVPLYTLEVPRDLARLPEVRRLVRTRAAPTARAITAT